MLRLKGNLKLKFNFEEIQFEGHVKLAFNVTNANVQVLPNGAGLLRLPRLLQSRKDDGHSLETARSRAPRQDSAGQRARRPGEIHPRLAGANKCE